MKIEHQKLKEICDEIGYESTKYYFNTNTDKQCFIKEAEVYIWEWEWTRCSEEKRDLELKADVREIIFTQEFMDKLFKEYNWDDFLSEEEMAFSILENLDNIVEYLYNLIKNNENNKPRN